MNNYFELRISINPEIEDIVSDICFSNFECEGVVTAEETYKDLKKVFDLIHISTKDWDSYDKMNQFIINNL